MASNPAASLPTAPIKPVISETLKTQLLDAVTESNAIYAGRGSSQYVAETLLTKFDRFGNSAVQINSEHIGLTFISRPRFNLTTRSLRQDPTLAMMDTMDPLNWMFGIRCNLDSVFAQSPVAASLAGFCPWFNDTSAFNVPLTNLMIAQSGWPDFGVEYETTQSGVFSEDMSLVRGSDWGRRSYTINFTFRDIQGGFLMCYFYYWLYLMALQMNGTIVAYPDDRDANRLNYTCSIYRFTLDPSMRTITKWGKATGCFPLSIPIGDVFNYGVGDSFNHTSREFSIPFMVNNVRYMDPRQLAQFNTLVQRYAPDQVDQLSDNRILVPATANGNFAGLPWVDLRTGSNELQWYAKPEELIDPVQSLIESITNQLSAASTVKP